MSFESTLRQKELQIELPEHRSWIWARLRQKERDIGRGGVEKLLDKFDQLIAAGDENPLETLLKMKPAAIRGATSVATDGRW